MSEKLPGQGFLGWLGRQVGHIKRASKADPAKQVIHRNQRTQEAPHPANPEVKLRRTVIDEVIVEKKKLK